MSTLNQEAPPAQDSKQTDFIRLEPLPEPGPVIMTIVAFSYLKDYVQVKQDGTSEVFNALEFFFGVEQGGKPYFVKPWPMRYSINERATYAKLYKAATGKDPVAGTNPKDLIGLGITVDVKNENKTSKKGKAYTVSKVGAYTPVHPKLKSEVVPVATLRPALDAALAAKPAEQEKEDAPF